MSQIEQGNRGIECRVRQHSRVPAVYSLEFIIVLYSLIVSYHYVQCHNLL